MNRRVVHWEGGGMPLRLLRAEVRWKSHRTARLHERRHTCKTEDVPCRDCAGLPVLRPDAEGGSEPELMIRRLGPNLAVVVDLQGGVYSLPMPVDEAIKILREICD